MPRSLASLFGAEEKYSMGQVRRVVETLRLDDERAALSYAACCVEPEFLKVRPELGVDDYRRMRTEIMELFDIDRPKFNCEHLRALKNIPRSNRWAVIGNDQRGTYGGGAPHDEGMM